MVRPGRHTRRRHYFPCTAFIAESDAVFVYERRTLFRSNTDRSTQRGTSRKETPASRLSALLVRHVVALSKAWSNDRHDDARPLLANGEEQHDDGDDHVLFTITDDDDDNESRTRVVDRIPLSNREAGPPPELRSTIASREAGEYSSPLSCCTTMATRCRQQDR